MLGLSKIQLGLLIGAGLLVVSLAAYAKYATERLGEAKAVQADLEQGLKEQVKQTWKLRERMAKTDAILSRMQAENAELRQRKEKTKTVFREVLVNDPKAAECGNAPLPDSVTRVVRDYAGSDQNGDIEAPAEPVSDGA